MSKDIKDYLHLYLGCDIMHKDGTTATMIAVGRHAAGFIHHDTNMYGEQNQDTWDNKLILRRLSDMTDQEKQEILAIQWDNKNRPYSKEEMDILLYEPNQWIPDAFVWLLSKGFDIFDLIDAGLAIDKTTI